MSDMLAGLYGLKNTNRKNDDLWGKNQFNSSFPAALACYMRDKQINPIYLYLDKDLKVQAREISFDEVFGTTIKNEDLNFLFEHKFEPYQKLAFDDIKGIDLVLKHKEEYIRPLEIKLTVIPDSTTYKDKMQENWGAEIVIRPASTSYCALGIAHSCNNKFNQVREIFEDTCENIQHWDNKTEISTHGDQLLNCLDSFQLHFIEYQKPFLMQPIWKTKGKSPILDDNAFDIFVWSDFSLCRTFLDRSRGSYQNSSRFMRSSARLARILYELACKGKTNISRIYTEMGFGHQSDKEFALSGRITKDYMNHERRYQPILSPQVLKSIILNNGQEKLSPERRFDQSVYYTAAHLFEGDI